MNTILARNTPAFHPLVTSACVMLMASAMMLPAAGWLDVPWRLAPAPPALLAAAWLGVVATAAATVLYFHIIAVAGPTFLSLINYLIPVVALLAGVAALGEALEPGAVGALALILSGLWISQASAQPAEPRPGSA